MPEKRAAVKSQPMKLDSLTALSMTHPANETPSKSAPERSSPLPKCRPARFTPRMGRPRLIACASASGLIDLPLGQDLHSSGVRARDVGRPIRSDETEVRAEEVRFFEARARHLRAVERGIHQIG